MPPRSAIFPLLLIVLASTAGAAETGSGLIQSGSGTVQETRGLVGSGSISREKWASAREERAKDFRRRIRDFEKQREALNTQRATFQEERGALRRECRKEIRYANRDAKMGVILRCLRGEMTAYREFLRKELAYAEAMPGIPETVREMAMTKLSSILDAVMTVISAVDSSVYSVPDDVAEVKKNLWEKYQTPAAEALQSLHAQHALSWISSLLGRLPKAAADDKAAGGTHEAAWLAAEHCLLRSEDALHILLTAVSLPREPYTQSLRDLEACLGEVEAIPITKPPPLPSSSARSSVQLNRRTQRTLKLIAPHVSSVHSSSH